MRLADLDDLPQDIIGREIRTHYAVISERFCLQNREVLAEVFDQNAILCRLGILNRARVQEILAASNLRQKHSRSLFRLALLERRIFTR